MGWSSQEVAAYFGFAENTVRKWAIEFAQYLSPTANPGNGRNRNYTVDDLEVIDLVANYKKNHATYEDIHVALKTGQRGDAPDLTAQDLEVLTSNENEKLAVLEIRSLQKTIIDLTERLNRAEEKVEQVHEIEKEKVRLSTQLEMTQTEFDTSRTQLQSELKDARERIDRLTREIGEQYTKGVMDTLERVGQLPPRTVNGTSE